jgi:hypothetical protein
MKTQVFEGSKEKIVEQLDHVEGRIIRAIVMVEEPGDVADANDPAALEDWEKAFNEMIALAPLNEKPADVSREAIYSPEES